MFKKSNYLVFIALTMMFCLPALAADVTWDGGGGDHLWATASNWDTDTVPGTADVAYLDKGANDANKVLIDRLVSDIVDLYVGYNAGGSLEVGSGGSLTCSDIVYPGLRCYYYF